MADVNIWGMAEVTKTFLPLLKKSQGRIVNMSSMAGKRIIHEISVLHCKDTKVPQESRIKVKVRSCVQSTRLKESCDLSRPALNSVRFQHSIKQPGALNQGQTRARAAES